jgi:hypothetical protein
LALHLLLWTAKGESHGKVQCKTYPSIEDFHETVRQRPDPIGNAGSGRADCPYGDLFHASGRRSDFEGSVDTTASAYIAYVADGGNKVRLEKEKQEQILIEMLRKDAHYVEYACNQDMDTFLLSGYRPVPIGPFPSKPLDQPAIVSVDYGPSGKMIVRYTSIYKVKVYALQFGVSVAGTPPTALTTLTLGNAKPVTVSNLTPGTMYQFQVRAYGALGWTEWSDPITRMCT